MLTRQGAPVTLRALLQRINRKLRDEHQMIRFARGPQARKELGDFYQVDYGRNVVVAKDVNVEALGRKLKVLAAWEHLRAREGGVL